MELNIKTNPNTIDEWKNLLMEEMANQDVPVGWREVVIIFMADTLERIMAMYKWFLGSRDIPYNSLTMVEAMIRIQREIPKDYQ